MLKKLKKDIDRELGSFLSEVINKYNIHPTANLLFSGIRDFTRREGKRIRPLLFLK